MICYNFDKHRDLLKEISYEVKYTIIETLSEIEFFSKYVTEIRDLLNFYRVIISFFNSYYK